MENSKKVEQYELIKVIATILVVLAHITRMYTGEGVVNPLNESLILNYLTKFIYSFHMPLFVAVSGAIYYYVKVRKTCIFRKCKIINMWFRHCR